MGIILIGILIMEEVAAKIQVEHKDDYLLVIISDVIITLSRALDIFGTIAEHCKELGCNKVLLDERTVQRRDITGTDTLDISLEMSKVGLYKIFIAFWCKKELIDEQSGLLRIFSQADEFMIQHFVHEHHAVDWLNSRT